MIKFFRRIRQRLLSENKFSKYMLYAIGEIVLVVVGILIAIQLNNRNTAKNKHLKIEDLKYKLVREVSENINSVNENEIRKAKIMSNKISELLDFIGKPDEIYNKKRIDSLLLFSTVDYDLTLNLNTLTEAKANGEIFLLTNDSLRNALNHLLKFEKFVQEKIVIINSDNNNFNLPYYYKNMNFRNLMVESQKFDLEKVEFSRLEENDYVRILTDREFENLVTMRYNYAIVMLNLFEEMRDHLELLHQVLEDELR